MKKRRARPTKKLRTLPDLFPQPLEGDLPNLVPSLAIIGRPNVGKSTLFNRILGQRKAIVDDVPGVTRDRNLACCDYQGRVFQLMDTGGLDPSASEGMLAQIKRQSELAISEADILIFLMDGRAGLTPMDQEIAMMLRGIEKPVFWSVNKIDTPKSEPLLADFYQLGRSEIFPISSESGIGVDELLEGILPLLPKMSETEVTPPPKVAVVGRPNVGKSTLVNATLGQDRLVVSEQPGTTRDPVDSLITIDERQYVLTDTAGMRRRGRIDRGIEGYSVARAIRALGRSDVAVLLLDGVEGVTEQDSKIAGLIQKQGRGCVLLVNKWDLRQEEPEAQTRYIQDIQRRFPFFGFVPVVFGAAIEPSLIKKLFPKIDTVMEEFSKRVPTGRLNQFLQKALEKNPLPYRRGQPTKSVFMTQVSTRPPTFVLFVKHPDDVSPTYRRYLENSLRQSYGFVGAPIRILVRKS